MQMEDTGGGLRIETGESYLPSSIAYIVQVQYPYPLPQETQPLFVVP